MRASFIFAASLLALSACGGGAGNEGAGNAGAGPSPPAPGPGQQPANITLSTPEVRAEIRSGGAAVANWPEGVPPYPGAQTSQSVDVTAAQAGQGGRILGFRTADTPQRVISFYAAEALRGGYSIANQMDLGQSATLTARRGEGQALNVTATRVGDATQVQIIAGGR
ncbi:MAG TPA: hypothetical protein VEX35_01620 [Allosphingosinicella sp.]|nr:hypothetical protein [Allosphingosinicella sp.]